MIAQSATRAQLITTDRQTPAATYDANKGHLVGGEMPKPAVGGLWPN